MGFKFSKRSLAKLEGVHPDLVKVITTALKLSKVDFSVIEGVRTVAQQRINVATGKSQTMNSKHLKQKDGYSHAVDVVPYPVNWELDSFYPIAEAIQASAKKLNITVRWGGSWSMLNNTDKLPSELIREYSNARRKAGNKVFIDAPHFELIK